MKLLKSKHLESKHDLLKTKTIRSQSEVCGHRFDKRPSSSMQLHMQTGMNGGLESNRISNIQKAINTSYHQVSTKVLQKKMTKQHLLPFRDVRDENAQRTMQRSTVVSPVIQMEKIKVTNDTLPAWHAKAIALVGNIYADDSIDRTAVFMLNKELGDLDFAMISNVAPKYPGVQVSEGKKSVHTVFSQLETAARAHVIKGGRDYKMVLGLKSYPEYRIEIELLKGLLYINGKLVRHTQEPEIHAIPLPNVNLAAFEKGVKRRISELFLTQAGIGGHPAQIQQNITQLVQYIDSGVAPPQAKEVLKGLGQGLLSAGNEAKFDFPKQRYNFGNGTILSIEKKQGKFISS